MRRIVGVGLAAVIAGFAWVMLPTASPVTASAAPVQTPARIFASKCAGCHGADGTGNIDGTPNFADAGWQASRSDADLTASITNGKGKIMPAWSNKLSGEQIKGLVVYVRSLKK